MLRWEKLITKSESDLNDVLALKYSLILSCPAFYVWLFYVLTGVQNEEFCRQHDRSFVPGENFAILSSLAIFFYSTDVVFNWIARVINFSVRHHWFIFVEKGPERSERWRGRGKDECVYATSKNIFEFLCCLLAIERVNYFEWVWRG